MGFCRTQDVPIKVFHTRYLRSFYYNNEPSYELELSLLLIKSFWAKRRTNLIDFNTPIAAHLSLLLNLS